MKPPNGIFVWQVRYGENVTEEEANCNKFLQKYLYFKLKVPWCILLCVLNVFYPALLSRLGRIDPLPSTPGHTCTLTWISQIRTGYPVQSPYL